MKHTEMHTWTLLYCKETFGINHKALADAVDLFRVEWPNVIIYIDRMGEVAISCTCPWVAEGCAIKFQSTISSYTWWKEI